METICIELENLSGISNIKKETKILNIMLLVLIH